MEASSFKDLLLKPELLRAISDCGFEHPSEEQSCCIPEVVLGMDILCRARSGMGKTQIFVLGTLQQLEPTDDPVSVLVMCPTRELALQISNEYQRFLKYLPTIRVSVFFGGRPIGPDILTLASIEPHIVVGTPGRILALVRKNKMNTNSTKIFILDECDKMMEQLDMRSDVQQIFITTPRAKQVMMFTATLNEVTRQNCKKFMQSPVELNFPEKENVTLSGLQQSYVSLSENKKMEKLIQLLDVLEFNQVLIFVNTVDRCLYIQNMFAVQNIQAIGIHGAMSQAERLHHYEQFKNFEQRILVVTDIFARGMDIAGVNVVLNYDMPLDCNTYFHRVARGLRFGTKCMAVTFVSNNHDAGILYDLKRKFNLNINPLQDESDTLSYMEGVETTE